MGWATSSAKGPIVNACVRWPGHEDLQLYSVQYAAMVQMCWCAGYCQITCSRCKCCSSFSDLLQKKGLTSLLDAARAAGLGAQLDSPGTMLTLLAPTNAAFSAALSQLGKPPTKQACVRRISALFLTAAHFPLPGPTNFSLTEKDSCKHAWKCMIWKLQARKEWPCLSFMPEVLEVGVFFASLHSIFVELRWKGHCVHDCDR